MTILCISTFYKGISFIRACHQLGNQVFLLTDKKLEDKPWPKECLKEIFYLENPENNPTTYQTIISGMAYLMRNTKIDLIVALDDFDVEKAAAVREHFRIPGMGQTTARYFRDKLAMRVQARDEGISVPSFSDLFHDFSVNNFLSTTDAPWVIKPRSEASAIGIKKVFSSEEAWQVINGLGENRHNFLIEQFKPGHVFHVDSLIINSEVVFARCSQYLDTPFEVAHGGGIFRSITTEFGSLDEKALLLINDQVMQAFGMRFSATHTEVIKSEDGDFYFLETASRVGGAHLADMVEASSGINLWNEWAKIETAVAEKQDYVLPEISNYYSGIIISLCSQQYPDYSYFSDSEVVWKMDEDYHVGLIVKSVSRTRVIELMDKYAKMIYDLGYHASAPAGDKASH